SKDIDIHETYIPSMILQPLVENSIVHGFNKDQEDKTIGLELGLSPTLKQLMVILQDNGRGIEQVRKKMMPNQERQSYATQILYERLMLLNKTHSDNTSIYEIHSEDLIGEGKQGTRVTIGIPHVH
ncbi:MAG: hypothetical protein AAGA86_02145, partial [Bacteroidota bacterium]